MESLSSAAAITLRSFLTAQEIAVASRASCALSTWYADTVRYYVESDPGLASGTCISKYLRQAYGLVQWRHRNKETRSIRNKTSSVEEFHAALAQRLSFCWVGSRENFPWSKQREGDGWGTILNHVRAEWNLTHKHELARNLRMLPEEERGFHPESHVLTRSKSPAKSFYIYPALLKHMARHRTWICKPGCGSCGAGVVIFDAAREAQQLSRRAGNADSATAELTTLSALTSEQLKCALRTFLKREYPVDGEAEQEVVLQQYIGNPFLYSGRKFDVRCYLLIASVDPLVVLWHDGYIRVCTAPYDGAPLSDRRAHVTNFHVQREVGGYDAATDTVEGMAVRAPWGKFLAAIRDSPLLPTMFPAVAAGALTLEQAVREQISAVIGDSVRAAAAKLRSHAEAGPGQFALLGVDLLLDVTGKFWLIEFTKGPAYRMSPPYLEDLHTRLLHRTVDIAFQLRGDAKALARAAKEEGAGGEGGRALRGGALPLAIRGGWEHIDCTAAL